MATPPDFTAGQVLTAAQMNAVGLWLVKDQTFTSVTTVNIDTVFTNDFLYYSAIIVVNSVSVDTNLRLRYRNAGSTNSGASYFFGTLGITDGGTASNDNGLGATSHNLLGLDAGQTSGSARSINLHFFNPKETRKSSHTFQSWGWSQAGSGTYSNGGGTFDANNSFDGFNLFTENGTSTMTGTVSVFGLNK
jgi:hypothetical protein